MLRACLVLSALIAVVAITSCGGGAGAAPGGTGTGLGSDQDGGTNPGTDAGPGDTDAGPGDTDAGPGDTDAGPGDTDAGPGGTDAGPAACDGLAACAACGTGGVCIGGACVPSTCGDGCLDTSRGEQCDDGNTVNLDGCDSQCHFEQDQRATSLKLQMPPNATDSVCTANAIGAAIQYSTAKTDVQNSLDAKVQDGTATIAFKMLGLGDLGGGGDQSVQLGVLSGSPHAAPSGETYDGTSDLDWWYTTDATTLDSERNPTSRLDGTLSGGKLVATGDIELMLALGSAAAEASMSNVLVHASVGSSSAPTASSGSTPGHTASEHLDPTIQTFASMSGGELCGNVSAASLAASPLPSLISSAHCHETYDSSSSMLDLFVSGCTPYGIVTAIAGTQPDQVASNAPAAGAGGPYQLSASSGTRVDRCTDTSGASVDLQTCLNAAAYSIFFKFNTDRVILK